MKIDSSSYFRSQKSKKKTPLPKSIIRMVKSFGGGENGGTESGHRAIFTRSFYFPGPVSSKLERLRRH